MEEAWLIIIHLVQVIDMSCFGSNEGLLRALLKAFPVHGKENSYKEPIQNVIMQHFTLISIHPPIQ